MEALIKQLGIESLNEMQQQMLSLKDNFEDVILHSPTGTGKTLAYLLPLLSLLKESDRLQSIIIVPTRELALQVEKVFNDFQSPWKCVCCYGGHSVEIEKSAIANKKPEVVIGTPGRLLDHLSRASFNSQTVELLIIDEFDKALELGFQEDMEKIILQLENIKKRILISATSMDSIPAFTGVKKPLVLNFIEEKKTAERLKYYEVYSEEIDKINTLCNLIGSFSGGSTIVFCNHRESVERVSSSLTQRKFINEAYHGGLEQLIRERSLIKFKNGSTLILVSTDLASRGLDITHVEHIIHYHLPLDREAFIHRNGRTARWDETGSVYMLLNERESLPHFIDEPFTPFSLKNNQSYNVVPQWTTLYIGRGKKNNISKGDIAGFFHKQGKLTKAELGRIDLLDYCTFVAVPRSKVKQIINEVRNEKIKGVKTIIEEAK